LNLLSNITNTSNIRVLERKILRHFYKNSKVASKAHIDYAYLNKGSKNVLTVWIPLGDCSIETGGLLYLKDSHKLKYKFLKDLFPQFTNEKWITNDLEALADKTSKKWMYANYQAGDIIVHTPFIVHASLDCSTDYMRISTDIRYMIDSGKIDPRWLQSWHAEDGY
jgi:ectoine hydroxylase-related dioxygenase (phytanoyl-CoA dioxygenase family)